MKLKFLTFICLIFVLASVSIADEGVKLTRQIEGISYEVAGNPAGTPIIFIHAFPLNKSMWKHQVEYLRNLAHLVTIDIRGLGESELHGPYTLEFLVDDIIKVMDRLKLQKAIICGLSMGGYVALRSIQREPDRFIGLILANTKSGPDSDGAKLGRYQALKTIQEKGLSTYIDSFVKSSIAETPHTNQQALIQEVREIAESNTSLGVTSAILALTSRTDTTPELKSISVPTLILHGEFDKVIPVSEAVYMNEKIKDSRLVIIPKAGHLSNLENPEAFNEQLKQFLESI